MRSRWQPALSLPPCCSAPLPRAVPKRRVRRVGQGLGLALPLLVGARTERVPLWVKTRPSKVCVYVIRLGWLPLCGANVMALVV